MHPVLRAQKGLTAFQTVPCVPSCTIGACALASTAPSSLSVGSSSFSSSSSASLPLLRFDADASTANVDSRAIVDIGDVEPLFSPESRYKLPAAFVAHDPARRLAWLRELADASTRCFSTYEQSKMRVLFYARDMASSGPRRAADDDEEDGGGGGAPGVNATIVFAFKKVCAVKEIMDAVADFERAARKAKETEPGKFARAQLQSGTELIVMYNERATTLRMFVRTTHAPLARVVSIPTHDVPRVTLLAPMAPLNTATPGRPRSDASVLDYARSIVARVWIYVLVACQWLLWAFSRPSAHGD